MVRSLEKELRVLSQHKRKLAKALERDEEARKNRYPIDDDLLAGEPPPPIPLGPRPKPEGYGLYCYPNSQTGQGGGQGRLWKGTVCSEAVEGVWRAGVLVAVRS